MKKDTKSEETKKKKINLKPRRVLRKPKDEDITANATFNLLEVIIIILITGVVVSIISGLIVYNNYGQIRNDKNANQTISAGELNEFVDNYNIIINNYVEDVDKRGLLDAAISGMYSYLGDTYSTYIDPTETDTLTDQLEGEYEGIGVEIVTLVTEDGKNITLVNDVFKDSPADKAGILVGDELLRLDGVDLADKDSAYVANYIKKGEKTSFELVIKRENEEKTLILERKHVVINSVSSEIYDDVGYIKINTFAKNSDELVKAEMDKFNNKVDKLIIDLRDNTGGLLSQAESLSDLFVEKGKNIYQIKDKNGYITPYKAQEGVYRKFKKIAVLVNGNSASASEVLALALKESANATIVGVKTFGKGTVQQTKMLDSGAMVKYTSSYWLSPNGNSINLVGIVPDVEETTVEKQIDTALKAVRK